MAAADRPAAVPARAGGPGRRVGRDVACDALFPGLPPREAARALSKALSMARAALAPRGAGASLLSASLTHIWACPGSR